MFDKYKKKVSTKNENKEKNMDEIMKLKIKRKDLEKQTHKMENEMQKLKNKIFDKNEKKHKDIESALNVLKQEHEKSKKLYQTYKGEKLNEKLSNIFSKAKKNFETIFFFKIKGFYISEKNKIHQVKLNCYMINY